MKETDVGNLPPCPHSIHCLRLLDDLDTFAGKPLFASASDPIDDQDERLLKQLQEHLATCSTCKTVLARARRQRDWQRKALREYLLDGERLVPATTQSIFAILRTEGRVPASNGHNVAEQVLPLAAQPPAKQQLNGHASQAKRRSPHRFLFNGLAIATAAALLFTVLSIFSHFVMRPGAGTSNIQSKWNALAIGVTMLSAASGMANVTKLLNLNPTSDAADQLVPTLSETEAVTFDGVSQEGNNILYQMARQGQTFFAAVHQTTNADHFLALDTVNASNAVWMDENHALIGTTNAGIIEANIYTGSVQHLLPNVKVGSLEFYQQPYLYYTDPGYTWLYRVNLNTGIPQQVAPMTIGGLTLTACIPDLLLIYCEAQSDKQELNYGLYAFNNDGTHFQNLNRSGILVGPAPDHSLLYLHGVQQGKYELLKMGSTPQQDQVVIPDVAPGISGVDRRGIALAPDGHALIVIDNNRASANRGVWYNDIVTHEQRQLLTLTSNVYADVIGWNTLPVKGTLSLSQVAPSPLATTQATFADWGGFVLISRKAGQNALISSYNYLNGHNMLLAHAGMDMMFDGVSSDGLNILYQEKNSGHTLFFTLNQVQGTGYFFELDSDNALNAIWMDDNEHVLVATNHLGVLKVDIRTGQAVPFLPELQTQRLKFYHANYLYFIGGPTRTPDALYRINLTSKVIQRITNRSTGADFWLSPDGSIVYFRNGGPVGQPGILAVKSDGTTGGLLRTDGVPIGYAPDNSLVIMREVGGVFQVVRLGPTPELDQVLLNDVAPGAISLCDPSVVNATICDTTNIALAPYSHALVVVASYPDGTRKVWSDDLMTGKRSMVLQPDNDTEVQVPGWDRLVAA